MSWFDSKENAERYLEMVAGFDDPIVRDALRSLVAPAATLLELGCGPGVDANALVCAGYQVTASDRSTPFLENYRANGGLAETLLLDAVSLETDRQFDGLYSNKVLQHLTRSDFERSLEGQVRLVAPGGIALHSLWAGQGERMLHGIRFTYWEPDQVRAVVPAGWEWVDHTHYREMEEDDSFWFALRRV